MKAGSPVGFTPLQIGLHWAVVLLILFQYLFSDGIEHAWRAFEKGSYDASADFGGLALAHIVAGVAVLALAIWRLALRARFGAPAADPAEPPVLQTVAKLVQFLLYALLFIMPITGAVAWFGSVKAAGEAHQLAKVALLVLASLHVLGALAQQFVFRTDVLRRIFVPAK